MEQILSEGFTFKIWQKTLKVFLKCIRYSSNIKKKLFWLLKQKADVSAPGIKYFLFNFVIFDKWYQEACLGVSRWSEKQKNVVCCSNLSPPIVFQPVVVMLLVRFCMKYRHFLAVDLIFTSFSSLLLNKFYFIINDLVLGS